jgi:hypothetical protein
MATDDHAIADRMRQLLADPVRRREFSAHTIHGDSAVLAVLAHLRHGVGEPEHGIAAHVIARPDVRDVNGDNPKTSKTLLVESRTGSLDHDSDRQPGDHDAISIVDTV